MKVFKKIYVILFLAVVLLSAVGCSKSVIKAKFGYIDKETTGFTAEEFEFFSKTLKAVDYLSGYDEDINVDFVKPIMAVFLDLSNKDSKIEAIITAENQNLLFAVYSRMVDNKIKLEKEMRVNEVDEDWTRYTLINKYLLPPMNQYVNLLSRVVSKRDSEYKAYVQSKSVK